MQEQPSHFKLEFDLSIASEFELSEAYLSGNEYHMIFYPKEKEIQGLFLMILVVVDRLPNRIQAVEAETPNEYYYEMQLSPGDTQFILSYLPVM